VTFVSAAARGATRQHLLWVALALSLALNLCFIAGALWIRIQGPTLPMTTEERLQRIGAELSLDPQQKLAFERYSEEVRTRMQQMREAVEAPMSAARAELAKPDAEEVTIVRLFDEAAQTRRGFQRELLTTTMSFLEVLSPEQRAKFVEQFHQKLRSWGQRPQRP
jgi:Spy/CpxP family protein refolding chaperone